MELRPGSACIRCHPVRAASWSSGLARRHHGPWRTRPAAPSATSPPLHRRCGMRRSSGRRTREGSTCSLNMRVLDDIVCRIAIRPGDAVLEIGPGNLTAACVVAVEVLASGEVLLSWVAVRCSREAMALPQLLCRSRMNGRRRDVEGRVFRSIPNYGSWTTTCSWTQQPPGCTKWYISCIR
ncbi:hypothetical protein GQ55_3G209300 [Panicum hallii var. hallii]|uniref:Uncharacterized protein n=1 Tax=Panicum hallii var. hallii TaxID=1504633 RepID=A0A2T7EBQ1_9POAL|nr:hypothetical protein GQ55_3G209300 [Panicum hallii var. hallii]